MQRWKTFITVYWFVLEKSSIHQQSDQSLYRYTIFRFTICFHIKSVVVYQKANFQFVQFYSVYEEIPEEFLDETGVNSYFCHTILGISQSHYRIVRVSKGSNKKSFAFKVFHFCDSKSQQRFMLKEEVSISKTELESLLDSLGEFLKAFDQANKMSQVTLPKPNFEIGFTKTKDELFSHCCKDIAEHLNRQIQLTFRFETKTRLASFPSKSLNIKVINSFLQKLSTWVTAKSNISTRIDFLLLSNGRFWE